MSYQIRKLEELLPQGEVVPKAPWNLRAVQSEECLSYVAWNQDTKEALIVDPKREDREAYLMIAQELPGYLWLGVIDTHTHADHVSIAADLASKLQTPLLMHGSAPSRRVSLRIGGDVALPSHASPVRLIPTPGHTQDSVTVIWGPFLFGGDTLLFGDTGRDDLPGGSPEAHFESVQRLKEAASSEMIVLPGHDNKGGRASSWATQLRVNSSLSQSREEFIREARAFDAPAPKLLKESLRENFL